MRFHTFHLIGLLVIVLLFASCQSEKRPQKGILVVLVEGMKPKDTFCHPRHSGEKSLEALCRHAFSSTRTFASSSSHRSFLTSLFRNRSHQENFSQNITQQFIPAQEETLAEIAAQQGYRTGLFSGGHPLFHNFSWSQGFERLSHSDNRSDIVSSRSLAETLKEFEEWLSLEVGRSSFFSVIYLPKDIDVKKNLHKDNPNFFAEDVENNSFSKVFSQFLNKMWLRQQSKNLTVFSVGMPSKNELSKLSNANLNIAFEILSPFIDKNMIYDHNFSSDNISKVLSKLLQGDVDGYGQELIKKSPMVHSWSPRIFPFLKSEKPLLAYQLGRFSVQFQPEFKVYDSYSDWGEQFPLSSAEIQSIPQWGSLKSHLKNVVKIPCYFDQVSRLHFPFKKIKSCSQENSSEFYRVREMALLQQAYLKSDKEFSEVLWSVYSKTSFVSLSEDPVAGWLSSYFVLQGQWEKLSLMRSEDLSPYLSHVLWKNKGNFMESNEGCLAYFSDTEKPLVDFYKFCDDVSLHKVIQGLRALKVNKKPLNSFWVEIEKLKNRRYAKILNLRNSFSLEVEGSLDFHLQPAELYFFLPTYSKFKGLIEKDKS